MTGETEPAVDGAELPEGVAVPPGVVVGRVGDPADPRLGDYTGLTDVALRRRREPAEGLYMAESSTVLERALEAGHRPRSLLLARRWLPEVLPLLARHGVGADGPVPVHVADEPVLRAITGFHLHRGALAAMQRPVLPALDDVLVGARRVAVLEDVVDRTTVRRSEEHDESRQVGAPRRRSRIAILEGLVDHTNVGACFRSAAAMGVDAVLVTSTCADPFYRRSVRVSMGAVFQVPWTRIDDWPASADELKDAGYVVAGMTLHEGAITLDELVAEDHENLALVLGSEGHGLTGATDRVLDRRVSIPMMHGVDSLNVAAASAVAFYATR